MKIEKIILGLSLLLALCITSFAMPPEQNKFEKCNKFEKRFCPVQFQQCDVFMLLGLGTEMKEGYRQPSLKNEYNFRFMRSLSKEQKDKIKQIKDTSREKAEKIANDIKAKFEEIDKELSKDEYSQKNIKKLTKEINVLSTEKIEIKISERQQIRDALKSKLFKSMIAEPTKYDLFAQRLELTEEQQGKVESLFEKNKEILDSVKKDLEDKNLLLEKEFDNEQANFDTINSLSNEIAELSKKKIQIVIDTKSELKKILTDEQFSRVMKNKKHIKPQPIPVPKPIKPIVEEK